MRGIRRRLGAHEGRHYEAAAAVGVYLAANASWLVPAVSATAAAGSTAYSIYSATNQPKAPGAVTPGDTAVQQAAAEAAATAKRSRGYASTILGRDFLTSNSGALKGTLGS